MQKIILASTSPRRKELFSKLNIPFDVIASNYTENMTLEMSPHELAKFLSKQKAQEIAERYPDHIILGADTFVVLDSKLLGKPHTPKIAKEMLKRISGQKLEIITGTTITHSAVLKSVSWAKSTHVYIKKLSALEIENYVATGEPLDKAGAFAIQELGGVLIEKIEGDYPNAVGLSLFETTRALKKFGIKIL